MEYIERIVNELITKLTAVGLNLLYAIIILIAGLKLAGFAIKLLKKSKGFARIDETAGSFILSLLKIVLNALAFITAAVVLGIPMTSFITILASCGVAVGLALQGSLSNFAGGIMLLIFKPFKAGDYIETGGYAGTVEAISVLYTTITTSDNKSITLPNGSLTGNPVVNYNAHDTRRISFSFDAAYSCDPELVIETLLEVARANEYVLSEPESVAFMDMHKDSSVGYGLNVWCKSEHYWDAKFTVTKQVKAAFDAKGIDIPFPQVEIRNLK